MYSILNDDPLDLIMLQNSFIQIPGIGPKKENLFGMMECYLGMIS